MTSKIVVNNIESDAGVSTVTIIGDVSVGSSITATDITATHHGSGANLTSLAAANLTGTIADARISSSSVTQHVTSFSDDKITNEAPIIVLKLGISSQIKYPKIIAKTSAKYFKGVTKETSENLYD